MLLESTLKTDFIPMVKKPAFWISSKTLKEGDKIEIDDATGHQVLAAYPGAFKVLAYGQTTAVEAPKRGRKPLAEKVISLEQMDTKDVSDILPEVTM